VVKALDARMNAELYCSGFGHAGVSPQAPGFPSSSCSPPIWRPHRAAHGQSDRCGHAAARPQPGMYIQADIVVKAVMIGLAIPPSSPGPCGCPRPLSCSPPSGGGAPAPEPSPSANRGRLPGAKHMGRFVDAAATEAQAVRWRDPEGRAQGRVAPLRRIEKAAPPSCAAPAC
jgi:hypothetical protein